MQADALATSASPELDLSKAPSSRALVNAAGAGIQSEAQSQKKQLAAFEWVRTSGGGLAGVKMLFFVALAGWNQGNAQSLLDVRREPDSLAPCARAYR